MWAAATSSPPARGDGGKALLAAKATAATDAQRPPPPTATDSDPDHQDRGQGRRHHQQRPGPDDDERLGPIRRAGAAGHGGRQCGVNPRSECAKGGPARHRSQDGRKPIRKSREYHRPGAVSVRCSCRRLMPTRSRRTRSLATSNRREAKEAKSGTAAPGADPSDAAPAAASEAAASRKTIRRIAVLNRLPRTTSRGRSSRASPSRRFEVRYWMLTGQRFN